MGAHFLPSAGGGGFTELFDSSPDPRVHTSVAAQFGFVLGLAAVASAPFSLLHSLALVVGGAGAISAMVGVVTTGRPGVAGRALAPLGLFCSLGALVVVGLRYAGLDTAVGDPVVPTLLGWLHDLNNWFPSP
ncbi:MAG: hypothetical protein ACRDOM_04685 [Nocardioides sp.]